MKTIIAGSRHITSMDALRAAIKEAGFEISEVVTGCAHGVDTLGQVWAYDHGIPVKEFRPDWTTHGKAAGIIRNHAMGDYAEALVAVWDGVSKGSRDMIDYAKKKGLRVHVVIYKH